MSERDTLDDLSGTNDEFDALAAGSALDDDGDENYLADEPRLWDGDTGNLDAKSRDALVALLKKAFISSDDRSEWKALLQDRDAIATNLSNLYFNLVIDDRAEVAYASPARTVDNSLRTLVRDAPNNREETLLLLFLRERFRSATASGKAHVFTDGIAMYEYVQRFRPASATDIVGDERRVTNAIATLISAGLLVKTSDEGRYRVHRAIEALLPVTRLQQLLEAFERLEPDAREEPSSYEERHAAPEEVIQVAFEDTTEPSSGSADEPEDFA